MKQEMHVLGIDIAKSVFHAVGMDDRGNIVYRKRLSRHDLMPCIAKLPPVLIGIEACGGGAEGCCDAMRARWEAPFYHSDGRQAGLGYLALGRHRARCLTVRLPMPPVRPVRETFASYGSRQRDIMGKVHFANSTERSPWSACAFAGYLCTVSRPSP